MLSGTTMKLLFGIEQVPFAEELTAKRGVEQTPAGVAGTMEHEDIIRDEAVRVSLR